MSTTATQTAVLMTLLLMTTATSGTPGSPKEEVEQLETGAKAAGREPEFHYGPIEPLDFVQGFTEFFDRMRRLLARDLPGPDQATVMNATSVTRTIEGRRYLVNETLYSGGGRDAVFKVRVVDIAPVELVQPTASDNSENDVAKGSQQKVLPKTLTTPPWTYIGDDVLVNELASAAGVQSDPDAEWIHDLGADLRINSLAETRGWSPDPDSENADDVDNELLPLDDPWNADR